LKATGYTIVSICILPLLINAETVSTSQSTYIDEDAAIDIVNGLSEIEKLRASNPEVRIVYIVTETPEENGRWAIKASTDQGTHYSNVGIFFVYPDTGDVTRMDPLTGKEMELDNK